MKISISFDLETPSDMLAGAFAQIMGVMIETLRTAGLRVENFHAHQWVPLSARRNRLIDATTHTK